MNTSILTIFNITNPFFLFPSETFCTFFSYNRIHTEIRFISIKTPLIGGTVVPQKDEHFKIFSEQ